MYDRHWGGQRVEISWEESEQVGVVHLEAKCLQQDEDFDFLGFIVQTTHTAVG